MILSILATTQEDMQVKLSHQKGGRAMIIELNHLSNLMDIGLS
jgi:hypothetical protein